MEACSELLTIYIYYCLYSIIALEVSAKFNGHINNNKKNDYVPILFED